MSLVNACISRDRALVMVDTESQMNLPDGRSIRFESSKMFPLVHANVMLAFRGSNGFIMPVLFKLYTMRAHDFDGYEWAMKVSLLSDAVKEASAAVRAAGGPPNFDIGWQEIYLIGWSASRNSMVGTSFSRNAGSPGGWEALPMDSSWTVPWGDDWGDIPEPTTADDLQSVAREQVRLTKAEATEVPIGGRLLVAEITREGMSVRSISSTPS